MPPQKTKRPAGRPRLTTGSMRWLAEQERLHKQVWECYRRVLEADKGPLRGRVERAIGACIEKCNIDRSTVQRNLRIMREVERIEAEGRQRIRELEPVIRQHNARVAEVERMLADVTKKRILSRATTGALLDLDADAAHEILGALLRQNGRK